jgi:hypothetical protein
MSGAQPRSPVVLPGFPAGMKTAISIPDDVFADAERLARRLKKSRSELYSRAIREYIGEHRLVVTAGVLPAACV